MLHALLHGKLGRALAPTGTEDLGAELHGALHRALGASEDLLTAQLFGRLAHLPPCLAARLVLEGAAQAHGTPPLLPVNPEGFVQRLWPSLPGQGGSTRCEPDVLWVWPDRVIVIEVKWQQSQAAAQLLAEQQAARAAYPDRQCIVLAVGGLTPLVRAELAAAQGIETLLLVEWDQLQAQLSRFLAADGALAGHPEQAAVVQELLAVLGLRGIGRDESLASLRSQPIGDPARIRIWAVTA